MKSTNNTGMIVPRVYIDNCGNFHLYPSDIGPYMVMTHNLTRSSNPNIYSSKSYSTSNTVTNKTYYEGCDY